MCFYTDPLHLVIKDNMSRFSFYFFYFFFLQLPYALICIVVLTELTVLELCLNKSV